MDNEAALNVIEEAEVLFRLLDREYVCRRISPLGCAYIVQVSYP